MLLASAVPVSVRSLSLVIRSVWLTPVSVLKLVITGAAGAVVSMVQVPMLLPGLVLPAVSVWLTLSG